MDDEPRGFLVNERLCSTCIFKPDKSPINAERFAEYQTNRRESGKHQECHHATINHEHVACRGEYERWKDGAVDNYPVNAAAIEAGFPASIDNESLAQICERFGLIIFVTVKEDKHEGEGNNGRRRAARSRLRPR